MFKTLPLLYNVFHKIISLPQSVKTFFVNLIKVFGFFSLQIMQTPPLCFEKNSRINVSVKFENQLEVDEL